MSENYNIQELTWDSNFFGFGCCKVTLLDTISAAEWESVLKEIKQFSFISINNMEGNIENSKFIGVNTNAYLADIAISLKKNTTKSAIDDFLSLEFEKKKSDLEELIKFTNFEYSRFYRDSQFRAIGGEKVYREWLINSFENPEKKILVRRDNGIPIGYVLFRVEGNKAFVELIAVRPKFHRKGVAAQLLKFLENKLYTDEIEFITLGTQVINIPAINLYSRLGYSQVSQNHVYHMWNKK